MFEMMIYVGSLRRLMLVDVLDPCIVENTGYS